MIAIRRPDQRLRIFISSTMKELGARAAARVAIERLRDGLSYRGFATSDELGTLIAHDLALLLSERFDLGDESPDVSRRAPRPLPARRLVSSAWADSHSRLPAQSTESSIAGFPRSDGQGLLGPALRVP